uniref:Uncharacterized protein n=1 Tax=Anopheles maculatus TaxID=74869 RepID=A0A182T183_9DIPT
MYEDCEECMKCPKTGYKRAAAVIRANCSEIFDECRWNERPFDCCRYFKPIDTTIGLCFLLNSVHTVEKHGPHWLPLEMDSENPDGDLFLVYNRAVSTHIMNEDDIPHILLRRLQFQQIVPGHEEKIYITLQHIVNDPLVRSVDIDCLDNHNLIAPPTRILQPWYTEGYPCHCYPSCTESEIRVVGRHTYNNDFDERSVKLKLMIHPTQRYRRQIVREDIDVVVSIGGILGLFTGSSILSIAEFFYFFTVRFINYTVIGDEDDIGSFAVDDSEPSTDEDE